MALVPIFHNEREAHISVEEWASRKGAYPLVLVVRATDQVLAIEISLKAALALKLILGNQIEPRVVNITQPQWDKLEQDGFTF